MFHDRSLEALIPQGKLPRHYTLTGGVPHPQSCPLSLSPESRSLTTRLAPAASSGRPTRTNPTATTAVGSICRGDPFALERFPMKAPRSLVLALVCLSFTLAASTLPAQKQ